MIRDFDFRGSRVLLVGGYPPPFGGISVHVQALRASLRERGAHVRVLDVGSDAPAQDGVLPVPGSLLLAARLAEHAGAGYLVHAHISGHTPKSWLIAMACALARRPLGPRPLLTLHSGLLPSYLAVAVPHRFLVRVAAAGFGRIFAVSRAVENALVDAGVSPSRIAVAPAFIGRASPGRAPRAFVEARAAFATLLCCTVAPSPIYGLKVMLPALAQVARSRPEVGLALFGPANAERVAEAARVHGIADRVRFLGELDHAEALAIMAGSDLFVRPTLADGDAVSVREALALGRPVVASDVGYRPIGTRLFRRGDAMELARHIGIALDEPPPLTRPDHGLEAILEVYAQLLGLGGASARGQPCAASQVA